MSEKKTTKKTGHGSHVVVNEGLHVVVAAEEGGAGRIRVLSNESDFHRVPNPIIYRGDEAEHIANPDGRPYYVPGLEKGRTAFVLGRRWREFIFCVPHVTSTLEEANIAKALLRNPSEIEIIEVQVE